MKELHILATKPEQVKEEEVRFKTSYNESGTVKLSPYGEYRLYAYGMSDTYARRTPEYKNAYKNVTLAMVQAYDAANRQYTAIHSSMPIVIPFSEYEKKLKELIPQKYQRKEFRLPKIYRYDIELELKQEVSYLNFNPKNKGEHVNMHSYISSKINGLIETRQNSWQEAYNLFNRIEDAKEEQANSVFMSAYKKEDNQQKNMMEGNENMVNDSLKKMCESVTIPYNTCLYYEYNQKGRTLKVKLIVEDGINIPMTKATILASGKISVKKKLIKEIISDRTCSALSLVYFMGSNFFNVSPNISYVQISLYEQNLSTPLLWVEFERTKFSKTNLHIVDIITDFLRYPHVTNFKKKVDAVELGVMKTDTFNEQIAIKESARAKVIDSSDEELTIQDDGKIQISFETAERLLHVPSISKDIQKEIAKAKDLNSTRVCIDGKYRNILLELNKE